MKSALIHDITQRRVATPYRRFGTTYQCIFKIQEVLFFDFLTPWRKTSWRLKMEPIS